MMAEPLTADELTEAHEWVDAQLAKPRWPPPVAVRVAQRLLAEVDRLRGQLERAETERDAFKAAAADMAQYREAEVAALRGALDAALTSTSR